MRATSCHMQGMARAAFGYSVQVRTNFIIVLSSETFQCSMQREAACHVQGGAHSVSITAVRNTKDGKKCGCFQWRSKRVATFLEVEAGGCEQDR
eukprot:scaffold190080_cov15-Tisochrysis_lutea.AAC.2